MGRLKGKVAIVTGGAKGLGKEFCFGLAREGASVVMAAHRFDTEGAKEAKAEIETLGGLAIEVDVTSEADTQRMAQQTLEKFGRIDVLVNNAAIVGGITRAGVLETPVDEFERVILVNLKGPFLATRAVVPQMKAQNSGKVIVLSSETALTGSRGMIHYVTSKGGLLTLTKSLAAELGQYNICVNAVAPGFTDTPAARTIGDVKTYDTSKTPLARLEQPGDLVGAVLFFASDESNFITGQTLVVDGGRYMH